MRDIERIDPLLAELKKLWLKYPDMRFGQLLENFVFPSVATRAGGMAAFIWAQEDDITLLKIQKRLELL
jgi:hypothetical protein